MMRYFLIAGFLTCGFAQAAPWLNLPSSVTDRIDHALPAHAYVQPRRKRVVLIYSFPAGWTHDSIRPGVYAFSELGTRTGAYMPVISNDPAMFDPQRISQFDAIILNNTTGDFMGEPAQDLANPQLRMQGNVKSLARREALLDFIRGGRGIIGVHAANDAIPGWPEIGQVLGATYWDHPWNQWVTLKALEPLHPLLKGLPLEWQLFTEIHEQGGPYTRSRVHELLAVDTLQSDPPDFPVHRTDGDFPVAWIRREGLGRVFFCSLGHESSIFWNSDVLEFYLRGIQYALGDLDAPDAPSDPAAPPPVAVTSDTTPTIYRSFVPNTGSY